MSREAIKTEEYKGYKIELFQDEDPQNPIKDWDMLRTFSCLNRKYDLSCSKNTLKTREDILEHIRRYEHGGITISTGAFNDPWDSGQAGYVHVTKEDIRKEFSCKRVTKAILEKTIKIMQGEVEVFDQYLQGDVYGKIITAPDGEEIENCWGFFPSKAWDTDELMEEAKREVDGCEENKFRKYGKQAEIEFAE